MVKLSIAIGGALKRRFRFPTPKRRRDRRNVADVEGDQEWAAIRRDLENAYGGPLALDAEDLQMLRAIFVEAEKQYGSRSDVMRTRHLIT